MRQLTLFLMFAVAVSAGPAWCAGDPLKASFLAPPMAARPMVRWWWPGGMVDDRTIASELKALATAGFGAVEIQPFRAGLGALDAVQAARVNDYASPAFFGHVAAAARSAHALGMAVDITLGTGWPSGGGMAITPELAEVELRSGQVALQGPSQFDGMVPPVDQSHFPLAKRSPPLPGQVTPDDWAPRFAARGQRVAVFAIRGRLPRVQKRESAVPSIFPAGVETLESGTLDMASAVDLSDKVGADGRLSWSVPEGDWVLFNFERVASQARVNLSVGSGPQLVLDHFNPAALRAHAERVLGAGAEILRPVIGKGLRSVFVDSFELPVEQYWSDDFLTQFRQRRGYELKPYLPLILRHQWMHPYAKVAGLPQYLVAPVGARVEADYRRTVGELFREGFVLPVREWAQAHGFSLRLQAHGGPADLVATYADADIPETEDLFMKGRSDFYAAARSAGDIYGKAVVASESLIMPGHPTDAQPAMWKARADTLLASGVNRMIMHGAAYPAIDAQRAGWLPFGALFGSNFNPRNPVFAGLRPFTDYLARVQAVMQITRTVAPVAIYRDSLVLQDAADGPLSEPSSMHQLERGGYKADWLTADGLLKASVDAGELVMPSGHRFKAVVVDDLQSMRPDSAERLAQLAAVGVVVLLSGSTPMQADGLARHDDGDARVARAGAAILGPDGEALPPGLLGAALAARGVQPNLAFKGEFRPDYLEKTDGARRVLFLSNPTGRAQLAALRPQLRGAAEIWYPWTGATRALGRSADGALSVALGPHEAVLVIIDPSRPETAKTAGITGAAPAADGPATDVAGPWQFRFQGFGADWVRIAPASGASALQDWRAIPSLAHASGQGSYATRLMLSAAQARAVRAGGRLLLDLGSVGDVARVNLNACDAWLVVPPFEVDVTQAIRRGRNRLRVEVVNTFHNTLSGTSTDGFSRYGAAVAAGLMGPVRLRVTAREEPGRTHLACRASAAYRRITSTPTPAAKAASTPRRRK